MSVGREEVEPLRTTSPFASSSPRQTTPRLYDAQRHRHYSNEATRQRNRPCRQIHQCSSRRPVLDLRTPLAPRHSVAAFQKQARRFPEYLHVLLYILRSSVIRTRLRAKFRPLFSDLFRSSRLITTKIDTFIQRPSALLTTPALPRF